MVHSMFVSEIEPYNPGAGQKPLDERLEQFARKWSTSYKPTGPSSGILSEDSSLDYTREGMMNELRELGLNVAVADSTIGEMPGKRTDHRIEPNPSARVESHMVRSIIGNRGLFIPDGPGLGGELRLYADSINRADLLLQLDKLGIVSDVDQGIRLPKQPIATEVEAKPADGEAPAAPGAEVTANPPAAEAIAREQPAAGTEVRVADTTM